MRTFNDLTEEQKEVVMRMTARYHYRNGKRHEDGSMGTIDISPMQLNELITECLQRHFLEVEG